MRITIRSIRLSRRERLKGVKKAVRKEGREEGIAEGREEGIAKGRAENAIEMARKFKEDGIDPAIIAKNSGLSIEEVEAL